jgi:hypothetical protein
MQRMESVPRTQAFGGGRRFSGMGRGLIGLCALVGSFVGAYVPVLWGASSFSVTSLVFSAAGGAAGVWAGVRLSEYY